jgi:hypothetical protein
MKLQWVRCAAKATALVAVATVLSLPVPAGGPRESGYDLKEIFVPQTSELSQPNHPLGATGAFDISPDGKTLAVEFGTKEPDKRFTDWVALWDVESQRLIATKEVEHDEPTQLYYGLKARPPVPGPILWQTKDIRFSPDGRELLVLTGPSLVGLSFPELKVLYSFEDRVDPVTEQSLYTHMFIEGFAMAANRLAILEQISHNSPKCCSLKVKIADLHTGKLVADWTKPGLSHSIALSPDASLLALTVNPAPWGVRTIPPEANNIFILNANSGDIVQAFNSGSAAGNAQFVGGDTALITMPIYSNFEPGDAAKLWNLKTGQLDQKLGYFEYGLRGGMSLSANGELLAVAAFWLNPADVRLDRDNPRGGARILLWALPSGKLVYASENLGQEYDFGGLPLNLSWGSMTPPILVRMSASGDRLAFGGQVISVNSVETNSAVPRR